MIDKKTIEHAPFFLCSLLADFLESPTLLLISPRRVVSPELDLGLCKRLDNAVTGSYLLTSSEVNSS